MKTLFSFKNVKQVYLKDEVENKKEPLIPRMAVLMDNIYASYNLIGGEVSNWLSNKRGNNHKWSMEQIRSIEAFVNYFFSGNQKEFFSMLDVIASNYENKKRRKK